MLTETRKKTFYKNKNNEFVNAQMFRVAVWGSGRNVLMYVCFKLHDSCKCIQWVCVCACVNACSICPICMTSVKSERVNVFAFDFWFVYCRFFSICFVPCVFVYVCYFMLHGEFFSLFSFSFSFSSSTCAYVVCVVVYYAAFFFLYRNTIIEYFFFRSLERTRMNFMLFCWGWLL